MGNELVQPARCSSDVRAVDQSSCNAIDNINSNSNSEVTNISIDSISSTSSNLIMTNKAEKPSLFRTAIERLSFRSRKKKTKKYYCFKMRFQSKRE